MLIRQGDVLVMRVESIPANTKDVPRENGRVVLAHGEVTGHCHAIDHEQVRLVTDEQAGELRMWMQVTAPEPVELRHDEHDTLLIPPGFYRVVRQREYSPQEIRQVAD